MARARKPKVVVHRLSPEAALLEVLGAHCRSDEDDVLGYVPDGVCAQFGLRDRGGYVRIGSARVAGNARRQKLGTAVYEYAARYACASFGKPLASDYRHSRSPSAEAFWQKQLIKGRAKLIGEGDDNYYVLTCPAPKSLAGMKTKPSRSKKR